MIDPFAEVYHQHDLYSGRAALAYHRAVLHDTSEVRELIGLIRGRGAMVLELAAGSGRLTLPLARYAKAIVAVDSSVELATLLKERLHREDIANVSVVIEDLFRFETSSSFDVVLIGTTSISMFDRKRRQTLFRLAHQLLKSTGRLIVSLYEAPDDSAPAVTDNGRIRVVEQVNRQIGMRTSIITETDAAGSITGIYSGTTHVVTLEELGQEISATGFNLDGLVPVGASSPIHSARHTLLVGARRGPQ